MLRCDRQESARSGHRCSRRLASRCFMKRTWPFRLTTAGSAPFRSEHEFPRRAAHQEHGVRRLAARGHFNTSIGLPRSNGMTEEKQTSDDRPRRLVDLAAELGYNPSGFLRVVRRRGFEPFKIRDVANAPYYLSAEDAEALCRKLEDEKNYRVSPDQKDEPTGLSGIYAIEVPAYDGSIRVKIGWSDNIADRLNTYRTIVPDLRVSRVWPCSANWYERMALAWAEKNGRRIHCHL